MTAHRVLARLQTTLQSQREAPSVKTFRLRLAIAVPLVLLGMITHGNYAGSGDAAHYMVIAHSVAFDRDLDVGNNYADSSNIVSAQPGAHAVPDDDGVLRPVHDVGLPILASPYFALAHRIAQTTDRLPEAFRRRAKLDDFIALRHLMSIWVIAVTTALALVCFEITWRLSGMNAVSFWWTLIWTLSPPILSHSYVFFTEIPSAFVALCSYRLLDTLRSERWLRNGLLLGALVGLLVLIHVRNIGLVLAFVLLVAWRVRAAPRSSAGFGVALLGMAVLKIILNLYLWGHPITTPHAHLGAWPGILPFLSETAVRVTGLFFDARHGLLWSAPIYLLAPAAWWTLRRTQTAVSNELLILILGYLLCIVVPMINVHGWQGGWSPAARFLVPIAPFLALAVPTLLKEPVAALIAGGIVVLQVLLNLFFWQEPKVLWTEGPGPAAFLERIFGTSLANSVPAWGDISNQIPILMASFVGLAIWAGLTWAMLRPNLVGYTRNKVQNL